MSRRLPPLNAARVFEAAARRMSILHAAAELGVTAGAVSRQVKALEEHVGQPLFRREHRGVSLTEAGQAYAAELRDALDRIGAATDRIAGRSGSGALRVCAYPTFALRWLVPRWARFYDRHPEIDLQLTTSLAPVDFTRDPFDAAVFMGEPAAPGLASILLAPVETFPVCSPALLDGLRAPADLARQTLLHSAPRPDDWPRWLEAVGAAGVDGTQGIRFESLNLAFQAAIEGAGVAIGIGALIEDDLASGRLARPFALGRLSTRPFRLAWPVSRGRDPRLCKLVDWLTSDGD